jgi:hypothetical protein
MFLRLVFQVLQLGFSHVLHRQGIIKATYMYLCPNPAQIIRYHHPTGSAYTREDRELSTKEPDAQASPTT